MAVNKPVTNKKGSLATDAILGQGAASLTKAVSEMRTAASAIEKLAADSEQLTLEVASKQEQIDQLAVEYAEKLRQADLDLDLKVKANEDRVATEILAKTQKVAVKQADYTALQNELNTVKADQERTIKAAEGKAEGIAKSKYEGEAKLAAATFAAEAASDKAKITSLTEKVSFLESQISKWEGALTAERTASVERAKASAIGSVNLTAPGK
jgi:hypothetical protein